MYFNNYNYFKNFQMEDNPTLTNTIRDKTCSVKIK